MHLDWAFVGYSGLHGIGIKTLRMQTVRCQRVCPQMKLERIVEGP